MVLVPAVRNPCSNHMPEEIKLRRSGIVSGVYRSYGARDCLWRVTTMIPRLRRFRLSIPSLQGVADHGATKWVFDAAKNIFSTFRADWERPDVERGSHDLAQYGNVRLLFLVLDGPLLHRTFELL